MKGVKKLAVLLMSLVMVLGFASAAFADDATGSIKINNAVAGQTYHAHKVFDLESHAGSNYSYTIETTSPWYSFVTSNDIRGTYLTLTKKDADTYYVTWTQGANTADFATKALTYAKATSAIHDHPEGTATGATTGDTIITNLTQPGYYLVDSTVGALCALDTSEGDQITVNEKNTLTTVEKKVQDATTGDYASSNKAQIGDTINFKSEITVGSGVEKLVLWDTMETGLTYTNQVQVYKGSDAIATTNYDVVVGGESDDFTFKIAFKDSYTKTLSEGDKLLVEYTATLNENAEIAADSNDNTTWVTYGDSMKSAESKTNTYTYKFNLIKTDKDGKVIKGAEFSLYPAQTGGTAIKLVALNEDDANAHYVYRLATASDTNTTTTVKSGYAEIKGLDAKVYYLEETKQPTGYNKLSERVKVDLQRGNLASTLQPFEKDNYEGAAYVTTMGGVQVINNSGNEMPSTGGMGTVVFYVAGGLIVLGAVLVLVNRKRKNGMF